MTARQVQSVPREVDSVEIAVALIGAKKAVRDKVLANLSERVGGMITKEMKARRDADRAKIDEVRGRIAGIINQVMQVFRPRKPTKRYITMKGNVQKTAAQPLSQQSLEGVSKMLVGFAEIGRTEGILALQGMLSESTDELLSTGLRLAIDGTDPELIAAILEQQRTSKLHELEAKYEKIIQGIKGVQLGANPRIVEQMMNVIYLSRATGAPCPLPQTEFEYAHSPHAIPFDALSATGNDKYLGSVACGLSLGEDHE